MIPQRLVLLGSVLVDVAVDVPRLPAAGGDVLATGSRVGAGGGFNVLTAAARMGLPAVYGGAHGLGPMGDRVRADLDREGVEAALPPSAEADTGFCVVVVDGGGERTFVTAPGVESRLTPQQLAALGLTSGDAVYVSGYDLAYPVNGPLLADRLAGLPPGPLVVVDPGPLAGDIPPGRWRQVVDRVDIVSRSEHDPAPSFPAQNTVVRRGRLGATVHAGPRRTDVPGVEVAAVDTTGAGDVHVGAMLAALAAGSSLVDAVGVANRAAAFSVLRRGSATGPTADELARFSGHAG